MAVGSDTSRLEYVPQITGILGRKAQLATPLPPWQLLNPAPTVGAEGARLGRPLWISAEPHIPPHLLRAQQRADRACAAGKLGSPSRLPLDRIRPPQRSSSAPACRGQESRSWPRSRSPRKQISTTVKHGRVCLRHRSALSGCEPGGGCPSHAARRSSGRRRWQRRQVAAGASTQARLGVPPQGNVIVRHCQLPTCVRTRRPISGGAVVTARG